MESASFLPSRDLPSVGRATDAASIRQGQASIRQAYGLEECAERWVWDGERVVGEGDDAFETGCVQTWLRAVIQWACREGESELVDESATMLVRLAGQSAAGARECIYRFFFGAEQPQEAEAAAASVRLRDIALTDDALGGRTWGAAPYLARRLMLRYEKDAPQSILELGAGTGLAGLALEAYLAAQGRRASVVLTDHHAVVLGNLQHNAELNRSAADVAQLDWQQVFRDVTHDEQEYASTAQTLPVANAAQAEAFPKVPSDAQFDAILAADCVYDPAHAAWIRAVALRHLARTAAACTPELHILCPLRPTHGAEMQSIYDTFSAPPLAIQSEENLDGFDDFGPVTMRQKTPQAMQGQPVAFRHFVIAYT